VIPILFAKKKCLLQLYYFWGVLFIYAFIMPVTKELKTIPTTPLLAMCQNFWGFVGQSKDWVWLSGNDAHFHG
jgi:hypothetical protein